MNNIYKVIISNKNLYKEIELPVDVNVYKIGTSIECDYRLHKEYFFEDVRLDFVNNEGRWSVMCADNLYLTVGDTRRLLTIELKHGDSIQVKYQESDNNVFDVEFVIDFDSDKKKLERKISTENIGKITIGSDRNNDIVICSQYIRNDKIELIRKKGYFVLNVINATYGVYHNGNKTDSGANIKSGDFIAISDFIFYVKNDCIWTEITDNCKIERLSYIDMPNKNNYPLFVRNSRIKMALNSDEIEILDPPSKPQKPKNNLLMNLLPSIGMIIAAVIMANMGGTMIIFSIISGGMAIVTSIIGVIQGKSNYKKEIRTRIEKYNNYILGKRQEIENYRREESELLNKIYPSKQENYQKVCDFSSDLFDRRKEDTDYLDVRLGKGSIEALRKINYKKQEKLEIEDELQEMPQKICEQYKMVTDVPVICHLKEVNAIGIIGTVIRRYELLKTMVTDLVARQFYGDTKLFFIASEKHAPLFDDFRMLPHVNDTIVNMRNIVSDEESKKVVFEYLYNILTARETNKTYEENYVVFFYDLCGFASHPISKFVDKAKQLGITFVFFAEDQTGIPQGCNKIINIYDDISAEIIDTENMESNKFVFELTSNKEIAEITRVMAAIKTEEISLEGSLTKSISLFELLNIFGVEDLDLSKRWASTKVYNSMSVPLGVSKTGIVYLDLHDKAHGPHGLVAGTTGSGKSEILQTYILSIATYFHPYEVAFVIIDFKGGGMVNQFKELPHLLGAITNIDGKEIDRSLKSIKAELQKRQRLFAAAEVNHIDKYIKKYKTGEVNEPLPHLVIIVDEFAELKAEQPEFMKELISAARIGRSLGVHLILATQKPAGQVDEQIWSNSRFKLCLKVQGPEDSNEVLKSPLAAEIKEPGRAYLQVGNNEIFELFQSAYSGESEKASNANVKPYKLFELNRSGKRSLIFEQKKQNGGNNGRNQLEAIVDYVSAYCADNNVRKLPSICLASLERKILFTAQCLDRNESRINIGIYDDPENQYQGKTLIDIDTKNTFIIGSAQYGKTNLLQLIIRELAMKYTPEQANIYILDFGSMVLKVFEKLNHVGGVVCSSDDEKLKNLFKILNMEIMTRKEKIVSVGVSSFSAYCEAGHTDMPHIYIFVDNMTALMELYLENDDTFLTIIREGLSVGITVIAANSQTNGLSYRYLSNFANKIALYCNDSNEYGSLFDHVSIKPEETPGRAIIESNRVLLEIQTYLAFNGEKEFERAQEMLEFINICNSKNTNMHAKIIPYIPNVLTEKILKEDYNAVQQNYRLPIGLSYSEVEPFYLDFSQAGIFGLCGKEGKGHYNFVSGILNRLEQNKDTYPSKVYIFDDVTRKYKDLSGLSIVKKYTLNVEEVENTLTGWRALLENRYEAMLNETEAYDSDLLLMIVQNNELAKFIYKDMDLMNVFNDVIEKYKSLNACIIFANYENTAVSYEAPEPLRIIKRNRHIISFDDLDNLKVFDVAYDAIKSNKKKLQTGDAYYINDNMVTKLRLVKTDLQDKN